MKETAERRSIDQQQIGLVVMAMERVKRLMNTS